MQTTALFPGMDVAVATCDGVRVNDHSFAAPRLRRPDRQQTTLGPCRVDDRLPGDHPARTIWKVVEGLDLSAFYTPIAARGGDPGRAATFPAFAALARVSLFKVLGKALLGKNASGSSPVCCSCAALIGIPLSDHIANCITAMQTIVADLDLLPPSS